MALRLSLFPYYLGTLQLFEGRIIEKGVDFSIFESIIRLITLFFNFFQTV
jgi:hypothetical protein